MRYKALEWAKRRRLNHQGHTDPVTVPQKLLDVGRLRASLGRLILETGVHGQDNFVISVLEYVDRQSRGEALRSGMELVDHSVAPPPPHEAYFVRIHLG